MTLTLACGDAGGDGDGGSDSGSSSSSGGGDDGGNTTAPTTDPGTSGGMDGTDSSGGAATDTGQGSSSGGAATSTGTGETGGTGVVPGDCEGLDMMTCEGDMACVWIGSPMNGQCLPAGPEICETLTEMQPCSQHPDCDWDNQAGTCGPAA